MRSQSGVTLVTMIVMIVIMAIIATVSITGGVEVVRNSKEQVKEDNLASVRALVSREASKVSTGGIFTPANTSLYGIKNAEISGKEIGENWYFLDEDALKDMGIEFVDETYIVNYKLNVVIPMSDEENIHSKIEYYNNEYK